MQPDDENRQPQVRTEGDKFLLDVPWKKAESVQSHLQKQGIDTVLCADAAQHKAHLELPPGVDQAVVSKALEEKALGARG